MFEHILVPLDGSSFGEASLRPALAVARRTGAQLTLLNVQDLWHAAPVPLTHDEREDYLRSLRRDPRWGDVPVNVVLRSGHPMAQILEEAAAGGADLIVMSTHGRGGVSRLWLGSVTDQCIRHAGIPLLLIRPQPSAHSSGDGAFVPHRVVVPLDGGGDAERALAEASGLARAFGIPLLLLRVIEERTGGRNADQAPARAYLDAVARELWGLGVQATTSVIRGRGAAESILAEAARDLVVMSTHARPPAARALLGSVSDKVVRGTNGAVLVVPPAADDTPLADAAEAPVPEGAPSLAR
jgi:nucleotide-binding universal stress UspA family protein